MLALQHSTPHEPAGSDPLSDGVMKFSRGNDAASLYFSVFDVDDSGYIELSDFKLALSCLLEATPFPHRLNTASSMTCKSLPHSLVVVSSASYAESDPTEDTAHALGMSPSSPSSRRRMSIAHAKTLDDGQVEELFHAIDVDENGKISLQEFKKFYDTVIITSTDSSTIRSGSSHT